MKTNIWIILLIAVFMTATGTHAAPSPVTLTVGGADYDLNGTGFSVDITVDDPQYILGAAFTVRYDTDHLTLTSVESSFFDTFENQFDEADAYNDPPTSVTVDQVTYLSPLVSGPESAEIGGTRIAGVRARSAGTDNSTLCTLFFEVDDAAYGDTYAVTLVPTVLDNTTAGYDAAGESVPMLITQTAETSFEEIAVNGIVAGTVSVTDTSETQVAGTLSFDGQPLADTDITVISSLTGATYTTTTDDEGHFTLTLSNSEAGAELTIGFDHEGYGNFTTGFTVADGSITANFSNTAPEKPVIVSLTETTGLTPEIVTHAFDDANNGHGETEWQIVDVSKLADSSLALSDLIGTDGIVSDESFLVYWANDATHLTELTIPVFYLAPDTSYAVRARFTDNCPAGAATSKWSDFMQFQTQATPEGYTESGGALVPDDHVLSEEELADFEAGVIGLRSAESSLNMGLAQPEDGSINQLSALSLSDLDDAALSAMPEALEIPYGLMGFNLVLDDAGTGEGTVKVTVYFNEAIAEGLTWWKYDSRQQLWIDYSDYASFSQDRTSVELTLKDGAYGDEDGLENGQIIDPGGVGTMTKASSGDTGSDGGSGCFIETLSGPRAMATLVFGFIGIFAVAFTCLFRQVRKD